MNLLRALPVPRPWNAKLEWPKTRFIEYTDDTFTTKKPQPEWLGILGPIIRAEVGDEVDVTFMNRTRQPHNMHPHGLRYDKNSEGSFYIPFGKGDRVPPGRKFHLSLVCHGGQRSGAGATEFDCVVVSRPRRSGR